jgi:esterase
MLNYRLYGQLEPAQPPLVVLHGLLGSLDNWHGFARGQEGKRTVLALDLRNHGASPHQEGMSYREMLADVLEVLDSLQIACCNLMGHSMGGKLAMSLALQQPQRIQRLLVVDIAPKAYPPRHQALLQAMATMTLDELRSRKQADEWLAQVVDHPFERGFLLKNLARMGDGTFHWQCNLPEIARHYLKISGFPTTDACYPGETLFIRGGQSNYVGTGDEALIRSLFPASRIMTIEAAGHLPHVQAPAVFAEMVETFLG